MVGKIVLALVALAVVGAAAFWLLTAPQQIPASALPQRAPDLANGKIIFEAGGCASCHATPHQQDTQALGGGLALGSPFGTFYVPNISPDARDGIGSWSEAQFATALIKGTSPTGQHYYPAFPYTSYQRMKLDDVRDLLAHIKTLPSVSGKVRGHDLPFPFTIRRALGVWKLLFLDGRPFEPDPARDAKWNRGAYLVNGPGHCAECHSPRNILGAIISSLRFAGGPSPDGHGSIPNITQHALKDWSAKDLAYLLQTGQTPDGDFVGSTMAEVVRNTAQLPAEDREAMATYIKSLPPIEGPKPPSSPAKQ
jgi:mono/diheme cytochrome c family protein